MLKEERQKQLLNVLYAEGKVMVDDLSAKFSTSRDTIRRDLNELEEQGILKRVYGGAIPQKMIAPSFDGKKNVETDEKYLIAQRALSLLKPDSLIAIDGGTTNVLFASLMPLSTSLRVVTNSFPVVEELRKRPRIEVIFLGGRYNKGSYTTVGETALRQLEDYHFDQCFLGIYALDSKVGASVPHPYEDEAAVKQLMVANSAEVNLMCVASKLRRISNYVICPLESIDRIICGHSVEQKIRQEFQNKIY